ncbi:MAG: formylglycine-generating enzyme family protein [bacterium]
MVYIPAGEFVMGTVISGEKSYEGAYGFDKTPYANEIPQHKVSLEAFYIDRFEVTFGDYKKFLDATGCPKPRDWGNIDFVKRAGFPVFGVTYKDAEAYAGWMNKRLPTEAEWERTARGASGRRFPWGDKIPALELKELKWLHEAGDLFFDCTPEGVYDLVGNVSEWTSSWYLPYKGNGNPDADYGKKNKVCRGFHYVSDDGHYYLKYFYRGAYRGLGNPDRAYSKVGFRCAVSVKDIKKK